MDPLVELLGESPGIVAVRREVGRLLQRSSSTRRLLPVLIQGETGTGKGLVARAIHRAGPRADGPFVDINCAAIPETLLEAELFGFERGAFTDARQAKPGLFQTAHRGTLFLDEIGLMPTGLQVKLLKAIEDRVVRRLGSTRTESVDVWILAATSEDLVAATREQRFRADLYHRLAAVTISLPPLRERGDDILLLADHFLARACADYSLPPRTLAANGRSSLLAYPWPGNIRELANVMERVALLTEEPQVTADVLGLRELPRAADTPATRAPVGASLDDVMRQTLLDALTRTNWNVSRAAAELGVTRNTIRARIEKYRLRPGVGSPVAVASAGRRHAPSIPVERMPPQGTPPSTIRWEPRRLALLAIRLVGAPDDSSGGHVIETVIDKVRSFGGLLDGISPRGVVAVFGIDPVEDAPTLAAHAAIAAQTAADRIRRDSGATVAIASSLHSAQALVAVGTPSPGLEAEVRRAAWNTLHALLERCQPGEILTTPAAAAFLKRRFELTPVSAEEPTYRLVRLGRGDSISSPRRDQFVDRVQELAVLRGRFELASGGNPQIVGISGEAGIGKSRLALELRRSVASDSITYLEGHCFSFTTAAPYFPVLEILRKACGVADADTPEAMVAKVGHIVEVLGMDPIESAPYLLHLFGLKEGTEPLAALSPEAVEERVFTTASQVLIRLSLQRPVLITVEDLHWIDKASEAYLGTLVDAVGRARILIVTTYRAGYSPPWIGKSYASQIGLQPLSDEEARAVVNEIFDTETVPERVTRTILTKAQGNPFFLEELSLVVREHGDAAAPGEVPATIHDVLMARLGHLEPEHRRILMTAAVVGKDVSFAVLREVTDVETETLRAILGRLQGAEFLQQIGFAPASEYTFKHALTHEVAYRGLMPDQRRSLHVRVVEATERLYPDRLADHAERLAHHALFGELWDKAVEYLVEAGNNARGRFAYPEAVAFFEQALAALQHVPPTPGTTTRRIDIRLELRDALWASGSVRRGLEYLREAQALAERLGDRRRLAVVFAHTLSNCLVLGDNKGALEAGKQALALPSVAEDDRLRIAVNQFWGVLSHALGDYRRAIEFLDDNVARLKGPQGHARFAEYFTVHGLAWRVLSRAERGEFDQGMECWKAADAIATDPQNIVAARTTAGYLHRARGEMDLAIPLLESGLELSRTIKVGIWRRPALAQLGHAYALAGRLSEALPLLEDAVGRADENAVGLAAWETYLGEAYVLAAKLDRAADVAQRALGRARDQMEAGYEAYALRLWAAITAARGITTEAESAYCEALRVAVEREMRPLAALCHVELDSLYRSVGSLADAEAHRQAANLLLEAMKMRPYHLEPGVS